MNTEELQALLLDAERMTEPLNAELLPYVHEDEDFRMLRHPLVYEVPLIHHGLANLRLQQKKLALMTAEQKLDWHTYVWLHERPHRLHAFADIADWIDKDIAYWDLLGEIWTDSENVWQNRNIWAYYLDKPRPYREHMMSEEERAALGDMPEEFVVYRGYAKPGTDMGWSWTIDREKAEWFAHRFAQDSIPMLAVGMARRDDVIAYFTGRSEDEILINPDRVQGLMVTTASTLG